MMQILKRAWMQRNSTHMTYIDFLNRRLTVMDSTAVTLCMENNLPILVLNFWDKTALTSALRGEAVGTLVSA